MQKIPVIVLSGFLGSGKTTLLLRLLQEAKTRGLQPSVLMNELGNLDVDGHIISQRMNQQMIEKLFDGCICCDKKSEVAQCLIQLLNRNPDVIFIELTGVANPEEVADALTEPQLIHQIYLKQVITVLDAENALEYNSIFESDRELVHTLRQQIAVADRLIVNKTDLVNEKRKDKIEKVLRKQNAVSPISFTSYSEINLELIFQDMKPIKTIRKKSSFVPLPVLKMGHAPHHHAPYLDHHEPSYTRIQTTSFKITQYMNPKKVEKFLNKWQPRLLRAKGYLPLEGKGTYLMQHVAKRTSWQLTEDAKEHYIVLIGMGIDIEQMKKEWNEWE
ncbi:GTP-binding protein [Ammoniphilus sp. 3BR4]|uniref:CobW family GTP-binding protein n=1 Tax=Ammoniphilus sp. 3BR4 TaxID=3158265 RepID=UPI003466E465